MCDYSLETYQSQPALLGETYETHSFPSHTVGFIEPGNATIAVCMAYDTRLKLLDIPNKVQKAHNVGTEEEVIFARMETGLHHDGVQFVNGVQVTLQQLGPGVKAIPIDILLAPVKEPEMVEAI
jgi:hypothetical protein